MIDNPKASEAEKDAAELQLTTAQQTINHYGVGSDLQLAVRAVTGVLQGIMAKDTNQAIVAGLSPYANQFIKRKTEDNTTANLMAHALLGAIEAKATGNNALAGATAGVVGETTAQLITERLYNKQPKDLTEQEKNTVTALSQIASGLSAGLVGDSSQAGLVGMEIGKRAVENNHIFGMSAEYINSLSIKAKGEELRKEIDAEASKDAVDVMIPHYINVNGEIYGIGLKTAVNLRNGDIFVGGQFSPIVLPNRSSSISINLGWLINLDYEDIRYDNNRVLKNTISNALEGVSYGGSVCYKVYCAGMGKTVSNNKSYNTFEIGVTSGGTGANVTEERLWKLQK